MQPAYSMAGLTG